MKQITLLFLLSTTYILSNINAVVSILPEKTFVEAIAGDKVSVTVMVQPGSSPHTYEPKPSQMVNIAKADLYFAIDVEFEKVWLPRFKNLNTQMQVIDLADNIDKIMMQEAHDHNAVEQVQHDGHDHEGADPHIWTAPQNVKIIAENIYKALIKADAKHSMYYKKNLQIFLASVEATDINIKQILSPLKTSRTFMVFHPSWGYFAKAYNLEQIAVEVEGKEPKPKALIHLLKEAKEDKVRAIFTQPEFSDSISKIISNELHIPVIKVSPLAPDWSKNLIGIADAIAGKEQ